MREEVEVSKVSTPENVFRQIVEEMPQPVGIVLFGADCGLKDEVFMKCVEKIPNLATGYGGKGDKELSAAAKPLSEGQIVLTVMYGDASTMHETRHKVVTRLKELGAKTVVGFHAKVTKKMGWNYIASDEHHMTKTDYENVDRQIAELKQKPPTADGLECLFTFTE